MVLLGCAGLSHCFLFIEEASLRFSHVNIPSLIPLFLPLSLGDKVIRGSCIHPGRLPITRILTDTGSPIYPIVDNCRRVDPGFTRLRDLLIGRVQFSDQFLTVADLLLLGWQGGLLGLFGRAGADVGA